MILRKDPRVVVEYPTFFSDGWLRGRGLILDLSSYGCRIHSASAVKKGDILALLVEVGVYGHPLLITKSAVRWINGHDFGMEFILMELHDRRRLDHIVQQTLPQEAPATVHRWKRAN